MRAHTSVNQRLAKYTKESRWRAHDAHKPQAAQDRTTEPRQTGRARGRGRRAGGHHTHPYRWQPGGRVLILATLPARRVLPAGCGGRWLLIQSSSSSTPPRSPNPLLLLSFCHISSCLSLLLNCMDLNS